MSDVRNILIHGTDMRVVVTKLHASRSQKNRKPLQHEQRSPGE
jgi:hypothetical protein